MQKTIKSLILAFGWSYGAAASAHEFWIETEGTLAANVRVGQMLVGENLPYLSRTIRSARHYGPDGEKLLKSRQGNLPALSVNLTARGLHLLTVETEPAYVVFDDLPEFRGYLAYEGLLEILDQHQARGLPDAEIAEEYSRYARALVQSGPPNAKDADDVVGMRYELAALTSPFKSPNGQAKFQLNWEGAAQPGAQIALFHRPALEQGSVTRQLLYSDSEGQITANVSAPGLYVFNAVYMKQADGPGSVVWQSHWASLSFIIDE